MSQSSTPPPFKHRSVQDLAWVIQSPAVISGIYNNTHWLSSDWWLREYQACFPALTALDNDPTPLQSALTKLKTKRLGERFECLVEQWLNISPNYRCLIKNQQLRSNKQTLGEIDFIIEETTSHKIIHLEVAIKFYLGIDDLSAAKNWYGPNLKDRLDIKLNNLATHQTQLAKKYPDLMPLTIDESWCMLKGRMFYPIPLPNNTQTTNPLFDKKHLRGNWYESSSEIDHTHLLPLKKTDWLAEITDFTKQTPPPSTIEQPTCCIKYKGHQEKQRLFLLPEDHWLAR
jgi:hypothetical protein